MLTQEQTANDSLLHGLQNAYQEGMRSDILGKARAKAWDHFLELGLPTRRHEAFRSIRLHELFSRHYTSAVSVDVTKEMVELHTLPECQGAVMVFVNGHYHPELSNLEAVEKEGSKRVVVAPLSQAISTYGAFLNNQWKRAIKEEEDSFVALNTAAHGEAAFFYLPPKTVLKTPIQQLHFVDGSIGGGNSYSIVQPRQQVFVGAEAQVHFVQTTTAISGENVWVNQAIDLVIDENAHVTLTQHSVGFPESWWLFDAVRTHQQRNSSFTSVALTEGAATVRNSYVTRLCGEAATASLTGLAQLDGRNEAHVHILMDHQAPHSPSRQLFKHVLNGSSRASFEGKILVRQEAQKTDAFQLNNNLILSDKAYADSKPNLEIFADDVKASHGSTIGQLNADEMFYLQARGLSDTEAKQILVNGFAEEVMEQIAIPSLIPKK